MEGFIAIEVAFEVEAEKMSMLFILGVTDAEEARLLALSIGFLPKSGLFSGALGSTGR